MVSMFRILVESSYDQLIVEGYVRRLDPNAAFETIIAGQSLNQKDKRLTGLNDYRGTIENLIVVFDQDYGNIADTLNVSEPVADGVYWCPAIPQIEAWLLADELALLKAAPESASKIVSKLPSPETIPYPKMVCHYLLRDNSQLQSLFACIDLKRAAVRCPSLANFLVSVELCAGKTITFDLPKIASHQIDRDIIRSLISEIYPSSMSIFKASSGDTISAEQMMHEIASGSALGGEYATTMLRVARDFLARQAKREQHSYRK